MPSTLTAAEPRSLARRPARGGPRTSSTSPTASSASRRQSGEKHGVFSAEADIGDPYVDRGVPRGEPSIEVDHPLIERHLGRDHGCDRVSIAGSGAEDVARTRAGPPVPYLPKRGVP